MTLASFLGAWCAVLSIAFIWPQAWRAVRHDTSHGLSPFGLMHALVGSALWLSYGIIQRDLAVMCANSSYIIAQSIIIFVSHRHGKIERSVMARVAVSVVVILLGLTHVPAAPLGYAAIAISGSSIVPQYAHVLKVQNLHGISIISYLLTIVNCMSWLFYGFAVGDPMISAQNFFIVPIFIHITWRAWKWRMANPDWVEPPLSSGTSTHS